MDINKLKALLKSRRFLVLVGGIIALFSKELFNVELTQEQIDSVVQLASVWIVSDSVRETK